MDSFATSIFGIGGYFNGARAARSEILAARESGQGLPLLNAGEPYLGDASATQRP
ncbi:MULTISPECIES: hypothetical protein [Kitasatospora]|uniref:hypothetical protein n=1 Tax=Kitasatospora TaxID=2063 RepID=UPI0003062C0F|nr:MULTISPECIES: hypothetical protein [Kitasatospora]